MIAIHTTTSHFRRSKNGAWLSDSSSTGIESFPDETDVGTHMHGARTQTVRVHWADGYSLGIAFGHTPVRGYGWGPLGEITRTTGEKELVHLCPRLPGWALGYYGLISINTQTAATFKSC